MSLLERADGFERCRSSATRRFRAFRMSFSSVAALRATMPTGAGRRAVILEPTAATGLYSDTTSGASQNASEARAAPLISARSARDHQLIVDAFDAVSMRRQLLGAIGSFARRYLSA